MRHFRFSLRNFAGLSAGLLVILASPIAYAQSVPEGEFRTEGFTSYIFSPTAITVVLVLALVVQLVYWKHSRSSNRKAPVMASPHHALVEQTFQAAKKRFDREEMSKALKATASSKSKPHALEEAIRLSQLTQPVLPEWVDHHDAHGANAVEMESHEARDIDASGDLEYNMIVEDEGVTEGINDVPTAKAEPRDDELDDAS